MGIIYVEGTVTGPTGKQATTEFLVDGGAKYTLLPLKNWKAIGLKPERRLTFVLADGTKIKRKISECYISLPQGKTHTPVVLGKPGDEALLGVVTLEELGLVLSPFQRSLQPARMMLA
ncbi:MAG: aspartyl protease [Acidobacteriota bacterium]|nr:aspartyl protease [Acidobacteriota bacterium]